MHHQSGMQKQRADMILLDCPSHDVSTHSLSHLQQMCVLSAVADMPSLEHPPCNSSTCIRELLLMRCATGTRSPLHVPDKLMAIRILHSHSHAHSQPHLHSHPRSQLCYACCAGPQPPLQHHSSGCRPALPPLPEPHNPSAEARRGESSRVGDPFTLSGVTSWSPGLEHGACLS